MAIIDETGGTVGMGCCCGTPPPHSCDGWPLGQPLCATVNSNIASLNGWQVTLPWLTSPASVSPGCMNPLWLASTNFIIPQGELGGSCETVCSYQIGAACGCIALYTAPLSGCIDTNLDCLCKPIGPPTSTSEVMYWNCGCNPFCPPEPPTTNFCTDCTLTNCAYACDGYDPDGDGTDGTPGAENTCPACCVFEQPAGTGPCVTPNANAKWYSITLTAGACPGMGMFRPSSAKPAVLGPSMTIEEVREFKKRCGCGKVNNGAKKNGNPRVVRSRVNRTNTRYR